jgi:hypothetical protein
VANRGLYQAGLEQSAEAYTTFHHALESFPDNPKVINNIEEAAELLDELYRLPVEAKRLRDLIPKQAP